MQPFPSALPAGSPAYLLPLTIRHVEETTAILLFELTEPSAGYLYYAPLVGEPAAPVALPLDSSAARHQVTLTGLAPATRYRAIVALVQPNGMLVQPAFDPAAWGEITFQTASGEAPLRIGVIGDAGFSDDATRRLVERMAKANLDFIVHTGDVVTEITSPPPAAYAQKYYDVFAALLHRLPIYTVPGNHDYDSPARWGDSVFYYYAFPPFNDITLADSAGSPTGQYYAFTRQGVQFLMLDSEVFFGAPNYRAQQTWLKERLADGRFRLTLPVFHTPPFSSSAVHTEEQLPVREYWHPLFRSTGIPLALSGHQHHYERLLADGITYIISGGGSATLYAFADLLSQSRAYARRSHFVLLEIHQHQVDLSAISIDGEILDQTSIALP